MALRLFKCDACGHRMRFAGSRCGACYAEKRPWQRPAFVLGLTVVLLVLLALVGVAVA